MATNTDLVVSLVLDQSGAVVGLRDTKNSVRALNGEFLKLDDTMREVSKGTEEFAQKSKNAFNSAGNDAKNTALKVGGLRGTLEDLFKPVTALNQGFGVLQQTLYIMQRAFSMTVGAAVELELQVAKINTVLSDAEIGQVDFSKKILQMQAAFGANPTEAARGFYESIASGATDAAGSVELMNVAQKLAIGGVLSLDQALSGLTSVMAAYGYSAEQTKYASDAFFIAAAKGKTNVEELTREIGNVSSIAQQSGVSFAELVSAISAVTLGGKKTAEATASVRSAINALLTPTEDLKFVYEQLGITSITNEINQRGLAAVYKDIYKYVNNNADALSKLVGRVEAIAAVVALTTGKQAKAYQEMVADITDSNRVMGERTERAFKFIAETSDFQLKVAKGKILASLTDISQLFMKVLAPALVVLANIISAALAPLVKFTDLIETLSSNIDSKIIISVTALSSALIFFSSTAAAAAISSASALAVSMYAIVAPVVLVSAKIALFIAAITAVSAAIDVFVKQGFSGFVDAISYLATIIKSQLESISYSIEKFINKIAVSFAESGFGKILGLDADAMKKNGDILTKEYEKISKNIASKAESLRTRLKGTAVAAFMPAPEAGITGIGAGAPSDKKPPQPEAPNIESMRKAKAVLEELNKIAEEFKITATSAATTEAEKIDITTSKHLLKIDLYEKELKKLGQLGKTERSALVTARAMAVSAGDRQKQESATKDWKDQQQKITEAIEKSEENINKYIEQQKISELGTFDAVRQKFDVERLSLDILEEQAKLRGVNTDKIKEQIEALEGAKEAAVSSALKETITNAFKAAQGGADALVGNMIEQMGAFLGGSGPMVAAAVNLLRQGGEAMAKLGEDLVKMLVELPLKLAEGAVGLVEGMLNGVIEMLSDPGKLGRIIAAFSTIAPKITTALIKSVPIILKMLAKPSFWIELASQFVRAIFDSFVELFSSIFDLFGIDIGLGGKELEKSISDGTQNGIEEAQKNLTGFSQTLFGVQEDIAKQQETAKTAIAGKPKAKEPKEPDWWKKFVGWLNGLADTVGEILKGILLGSTIGLLEGFLGPIMKTILDELWSFLNEIVPKIHQALDFAIAKSIQFVKFSIEIIIGVVKTVIGAFKEVLKSLATIVFSMVEELKKVLNAISDAVFSLVSKIEALFTFLLTIPNTIIEALKTAVDTLFSKFMELGSKIWEGFKGALEGAFEFFKDLGRKIWDGLSESVTDVGGKGKSFLNKAGDAIASVFGWSEGGIVPGSALMAGNNLLNDTIPAMLSPGEAVIPRSLMSNPDINNLIRQILNDKTMPSYPGIGSPGFSLGGGASVQSIMPSSNISGDTNVNVVLNIDTNQQIDENFVKQRLIPSIKNELKASSLRGDFVLSTKGVRR